MDNTWFEKMDERIPRGEIVIPANFSDGFRVFP